MDINLQQLNCDFFFLVFYCAPLLFLSKSWDALAERIQIFSNSSRVKHFSHQVTSTTTDSHIPQSKTHFALKRNT